MEVLKCPEERFTSITLCVTGDVLVFVNDTCVLGYTHQDVVNMFQGIPVGERVTLEVCRGYSLPFDPNDPNTEIVTTVAVTMPEGGSQATTTHTPSYSSSHHHTHKSLPDLSTNNNIDKPPNLRNRSFDEMSSNSHPLPDSSRPELLSVNIVKGSMGFGFTIADSAYGQKVKHIMDRSRCQTLLEGDVLVEINQIQVKDMNHADVVRVLKNCKRDVPSQIVIQRGGLLTPTKAKRNGKAVSILRSNSKVNESLGSDKEGEWLCCEHGWNEMSQRDCCTFAEKRGRTTDAKKRARSPVLRTGVRQRYVNSPFSLN